LQRAVDNAKPRLEVKARRVGGATYQVPLEVPTDRQFSLALRWLVDFADARKGVPMKEALAAEILEAYQGRAMPSANATRCIRWRRPTRPLPTSAGNHRLALTPRGPKRPGAFLFSTEDPCMETVLETKKSAKAKGANVPQRQYPMERTRNIGIAAISTPARPPPPSASSFTRGSSTRWATWMTATR
jgi:hypothetical protein